MQCGVCVHFKLFIVGPELLYMNGIYRKYNLSEYLSPHCFLLLCFAFAPSMSTLLRVHTMQLKTNSTVVVIYAPT